MTDAVNSFAYLSNSENNIHKELFAAKVKGDHGDYTKLKSWLEDQSPFEAGGDLVAIDTDLTDIEGKITCDREEDIGSLIQNQITGKSFSECSFKEKSQIIDPLTLFLRLVVMVERRPKEKIEKYFEYELNLYPISLFKHKCMRFTKSQN